MAYNFLRAHRDQPFLLPPDLRDWLPTGHLAWFILDVVDQLDLAPFYRQHRDDGHGHPAYDPKTLLGVLLYGYCIGVRSSRQIERRCTEDVDPVWLNAHPFTTVDELLEVPGIGQRRFDQLKDLVTVA
jgi:transposase